MLGSGEGENSLKIIVELSEGENAGSSGKWDSSRQASRGSQAPHFNVTMLSSALKHKWVRGSIFSGRRHALVDKVLTDTK
jgi:hypothetical protein